MARLNYVYRTCVVLSIWHALMVLCRAGAVQYSSGPGNIKGDVLVLDVTSLSFQGNHPVFPMYSSPNQCANACKTLPGCNAWTFCNNTGGCGSGCPEYVKSNPSLKADDPSGNPTIRSSKWKLPLTGFGPWGRTSGCASTCGYSCQQTGAWPEGMCSLKKVPDPSKPAYWSKNAKEGWVSGVIITPPACAGTTPGACEGCLGSSNPGACITCAKSSKVLPANLVSAVDASPAAGSQCVKCYTSSADPNKCSSCILQGGACQDCPLETFPNGDVDQCIACANKYGAGSFYGCRVCSTLANPQQTTKCISCFDKARKVACAAGVNAESKGYACADADDAVQSCSTCATSAADFTACEKCILTKPYSSGCGYCALLKAPSEQTSCYKCRADGKVLNSGCSDCLSYLSDPQQKQSCLSCLGDPKISSAGKSWCFGCQNWYNTLDGRNKCVKCLGTPQSDYLACSRL